jgi:hypothetical protein
MNRSVTVKRQFRARRRQINRAQVAPGTNAKAPAGRVSRISRLMALAIRFDQLIRDGVVTDQAELARLGRVSRARMTQIMNLLNLAPDIQDGVLNLASAQLGREVASERDLRPIAAVADWKRQRRMWSRQLSRTNSLDSSTDRTSDKNHSSY